MEQNALIITVNVIRDYEKCYVYNMIERSVKTCNNSSIVTKNNLVLPKEIIIP